MSERHGSLSLAVLLLAALLFGYGGVSWWPRTVDDAFITFHYSQHLVDGAGPVFNAGERVEGYSSPSWMALMAGAIALGIDPVPVSKGLGLLSSLALLGLLWVGLRRQSVSMEGAAGSCLILGSSFVLQIWAVAGMETNAFALLVFAGLVSVATGEPSPRRMLVASALLIGAALTRPEGAIYWGLAFPAALIRCRLAGRRLLPAALLYLLPLAALLLHLGWRFQYYGEWLPNTYHAKTGGGPAMWRQGWFGLRLFLANPAHWPWLLAAAAGTLMAVRRARHRLAALLMAATVVLHLAYVVSVGDDGLRVHRFYVPVLAPLAFLFGMLLVPPAGGRSPMVLRVAALSAAIVSAGGSLWTLHADLVPRMRGHMLAYQEGNIKIGRHLARTRTPDTTIAVIAAGAIPFYSRLPAIDMYGLNDAHIARVPFADTPRTRLMKWDNTYVLSRRPQVIVINRGYFRADDPGAAAIARDPSRLADSAVNRDLFQRISRDGGYLLRPILFEDGSRFYVFERVR